MIIFDVAVSFAGEDREKAKQLVACLKKKGLCVFYDNDYQADLTGKDLYQYLHKLYKESALFFLPLISEHYVQKPWAMHELRAAQEREFSEDTEYILPIKLDNTDAPGVPITKGYLDFRKLSAARISTLIAQKVNIIKNSDIHEKNRLYSNVMHSFEFLADRFFLLSQTSKVAEFLHLPAITLQYKDSLEQIREKLNKDFYGIIVQILEQMKVEDDEHINGLDEKSLALKQINLWAPINAFKQAANSFTACKYNDSFDFWHFIRSQSESVSNDNLRLVKTLEDIAELGKHEVMNPMTATKLYQEYLRITLLNYSGDVDDIDMDKLLSMIPDDLLKDYEDSERLNQEAFDAIKNLSESESQN